MKGTGNIDSNQNNSFSWDKVLSVVNENIIGGDLVHEGNFGPRKVTYLDSTASGKSLECIEEFIRSNVLSYYGNTHTESTLTGKQTSLYREEARHIIRKSVNASEDDVCILYGAGTTPCVHKLVHAVCNGEKTKPIVLIGPFEHHSNILPWRDAGAQVINIPQDVHGLLDLQSLETELIRLTSLVANKHRRIIGSFSVGSNVTGMVSDDVKLTKLLHRFGGYAFFDYAAAAPHVQINMNPVSENCYESALAKKDALFFSGHKFLGGPQTCGVLIAKKHVFQNKVPHGAGGGTVFFVTPDKHAYLKDIEEREEGGTPSIVQSIRLGLVFKLVSDIGIQNIIQREATLTRKALFEWSNTRNMLILGNSSCPRLPIISFLIIHPETGYYLHYNFVVQLLNDLFGIQSRGGCSCAGIYAQTLLGIDSSLAEKYEQILSLERNTWKFPKTNCKKYDVIFRPGFVRISLSYHLTDPELEFVISAVKFVGKHGWEFMGLYNMDPTTGKFQHKFETINEFNSLSLESCSLLHTSKQQISSNEKIAQSHCRLFDYLSLAKTELKIIRGWAPNIYVRNDKLNLNPKSQELRWFLLPSEAVGLMQSRKIKVEPADMPFQVNKIQFCPMREDLMKSFSQNSIIQQLIEGGNKRKKTQKIKTKLDVMSWGTKTKLTRDFFSTYNNDSGIDTLSLSLSRR